MLKANINKIKETTSVVLDITQQAILATSNEKEAELSAQINPMIVDTNKKANFTKKLLQKLKEKASEGDQTSDLRIRENLLNTLTRKFVEVMKEYQSSQSKYKTEIMKKAKRQIQIVKPDATEEEVDAVIRNGGADQLIQNSILKGETSESVKDMYESVNQRYNEIIAIEASVQEMHQMFMDFALLVEQQGEMLDSIEFQVAQSLEHVEDGNKQMVQAIDLYKSIRSKQCYCAIFVILLLGIIAGVIAISMNKDNKSKTK
tara:strand:- start:557 stop:1336 length:780 start_codon:yes stop_codon:yes gene_type:complete